MPVTAADIDEAKARALEQYLNLQQKKNPGEVRRLSDAGFADVPVVRTGAVSLDVAIGAGGFPLGRIIELYGPEMGGKTSLALSAAAHVQRDLGGNVGFIDAENALNPQHVLAMGVDPLRLVINQPDHGEAAVTTIEDMMKSDAFNMIIVDSIAALTPKAEIEGTMEDGQALGQHAKMMSTFMRRISGLAKQHDVALVLINQLREKPGGYGNPEYTPGGRAVKFYASVRIEVRSGNASRHIKEGKNVIGQRIDAKVTKNKVGAPFRTASFDLYYGRGLDTIGSMLEVATELGVLKLAGRTYTEVETGEVLGTSADAARKAVRDDATRAARIEKRIYETLATTGNLGFSFGEESKDEPALEPEVAEAA